MRIVNKRLFILIPRWGKRGVLEARYIIIFIINVLQRAAWSGDLYHFQLLTFWFPYVRVSMSLNNAGSIGGTTSITFHEGDDVEVFIERFDMAMRCGDVKEEKWTMKLLCSLSLDAYKRVKNEYSLKN